jgi:hypothetical protein
MSPAGIMNHSLPDKMDTGNFSSDSNNPNGAASERYAGLTRNGIRRGGFPTQVAEQL